VASSVWQMVCGMQQVVGGRWQVVCNGKNHNISRYHSLNIVIPVATMT